MRSESLKKSQKAYMDRVVRLQITLNPAKAEDAAIIQFLENSAKDGNATAATVKDALRRYMKMTEALYGLKS